MKSLIIAVVAWLVVLGLRADPASACSCPDGGPFSKVAPEGDLVVIGDVRSHHGNSLQLDIVEVLQGQEKRRAITVWGDNGMQCRPYVSMFPEGTRWAFSLFLLPDEEAQRDLKNLREPPTFLEAEAPFYVLSGCGTYWLEVRGESAYGRIKAQERGGEESISVRKLASWPWKKP